MAKGSNMIMKTAMRNTPSFNFGSFLLLVFAITDKSNLSATSLPKPEPITNPRQGWHQPKGILAPHSPVNVFRCAPHVKAFLRKSSLVFSAASNQRRLVPE